MTVDVELTRTIDAGDLARALTEHGLPADAIADSGHVLVDAADVTSVRHAVADWTAERGLPFVSHVVDERRLVLSPPGS